MSERYRSVFVAGAVGAVGRQLLPMLTGAGYKVFGTTRKPGKTTQMEAIGVHPVVVDVFDRDALIVAVGEAKPDVIIHQLTDLSTADFAGTDRLRIVGTRDLVDAAKAAGVRRMIAQSLAIVYAPGTEPATEQDPLADDSPAQRDIVKGVHALEGAVAELPEESFFATVCCTVRAPGIPKSVPLPMRCGSASELPPAASVHSSMWKMPRARPRSRSIGPQVSSISSTTNLLPARNGCRALLRRSERRLRRWTSTAASEASLIRRRGRSLDGSRCTRPGV